MATTLTWREAMLAGVREAGTERLAEVALGAMVETLAVLREDDDLAELARGSAAANLAVTVQIVEGAVPLRGLDLPPQAAAFARELARRNVPVADLVRAQRAGHHALWRWAAGIVQARLPAGTAADGVTGLSEATFATGDAFVAAMMERYARERDRWRRSADAVRSATVQDLLGGAPVDPAAAGRRLRYELRQDHEAFVVWDPGGGLPEDAAAAIGGRRALLVPVGAGIVAGWALPGTVRPEAAGAAASVALGSPAAGPAGFRAGHREAMEARRVARLLGRGPGVVRHDDVALLALLTKDLDQARAFVDRRLGALAAPDARTRTVARTLLAVLEESGSPRRAARRLGVHENTVAKRLRAAVGLRPEEARPADLLAALTLLDALRPLPG